MIAWWHVLILIVGFFLLGYYVRRDGL